MYGITEATVYSTIKLLDEQDLAGTASDTPIGRPLSSVRILLLDDRSQPVPAGTVGEMVLGGASVALGYVGNPAQSATRFVDLELADGIRHWLRTGDLARSDPAGELHFVGRVDSQVKINGYRIELGEVEAALDGLTPVIGGVASKLAGPNGLPQLGLLVAATAEVTPAKVRAHLLTRLPQYMVPGLVRIVDALPLGVNGKVDRRACAAALTAVQRSAEAKATTRSSPGE
jgi:acyl-CoA synthetase (AMP-forming)/AMP-acid ligase II